jgi:WD40 repeat protein
MDTPRDDLPRRLDLSVGGGRTAGLSDGEAQALAAGTLLAGRYEVLALLGAGGMGAVYRVRDRVREKDIALKVMLPSLLAREKAVERFRQEAEIMLGLAHPGIARVFDAGEDRDRGLRFYTMELLEGMTLRAWLDEKKRAREAVDPGFALEIVRQLLEALRYAHEVTVHRDLKPENVFLVPDPTGAPGAVPRVKVLDFGIAKLASASQFTSTSMALGTAYYMAPEQQLDAAKVDRRADLYSVSVILYEMLTGKLPVGRFKTPSEERKALPRGVDELVLRGLAPEPDERPGTAALLLEEVRAIRALLERGAAAGGARPRVRAGRAVAIGFVIACGALAVFLAARYPEEIVGWASARLASLREPKAPEPPPPPRGDAVGIGLALPGAEAIFRTGAEVLVRGEIFGPGVRSVLVAGKPAELAGNIFEARVPAVSPLEVIARSGDGRTLARIERPLRIDDDPPRVTIEGPAERDLEGDDPIEIAGRVEDASGPIHVDVGGGKARLDLPQSGPFRARVALPSGVGECKVRVEATDAAGNRGGAEIAVRKAQKLAAAEVPGEPSGPTGKPGEEAAHARPPDRTTGTEETSETTAAEPAPGESGGDAADAGDAAGGRDAAVEAPPAQPATDAASSTPAPVQPGAPAGSTRPVVEAPPGPPPLARLQADEDGKPLPEGALARFGRCRFQPGSRIHALAFSPSGLTVAAACEDGAVHVFDAETGEERDTLLGHRGAVYAVAYAPDFVEELGGGKPEVVTGLLASGGADGMIRLWRRGAKEPAQVLKAQADGGVRALAFAPDGKTFVSGGDDGAIRIWEVGRAWELRKIEAHRGAVSCLALGAGGKIVASGGEDRTIRVFDAVLGKKLHEYDEEKAPLGVALLSGDSLVASASEAAVRIRELASRKVRAIAPTETENGFLALAALPDGESFAVGTADTPAIKVIGGGTAAGAATEHAIDVGASGQLALAVAPDGRIAFTCGDWRIRIASGGPSGGPPEVRPLSRVAVSRDGRIVAVAEVDRVRVFSTETGRERASAAPGGVVAAIALSPEGELLAASSGRGVHLFASGSGTELKRFEDDLESIELLAFSQDGKRLAAYTRGKVMVAIWDLMTLARVWTLSAERRIPSVRGRALSPDLRLVAEGAYGETYVFDVHAGKEVARFGFAADYDRSGALAFSGDGRLLAGYQGGAVAVWDVGAAKETTSIERHWDDARAVALSSDGSTLAFADKNEVRMVGLRGGPAEVRLRGHRNAVTDLAFSADGEVLVSASADGTAVAWESLARRGAREAEERLGRAREARALAVAAKERAVAAGAGELAPEAQAAADRAFAEAAEKLGANDGAAALTGFQAAAEGFARAEEAAKKAAADPARAAAIEARTRAAGAAEVARALPSPKEPYLGWANAAFEKGARSFGAGDFEGAKKGFAEAERLYGLAAK